MSESKEKSNEDFAFQLEENAKDSLRRGIDHYLAGFEDVSNLKHAILLVYHSVELFLKARLAKEHPTLIFEKPEDAKSEDAHTVGLKTALGRLQTVNVTFEATEIGHLKQLQRVRNRFEHHEYSGNRQTAGDLIASTIKVLDVFLQDELKMPLESFLQSETVRALEGLVLSYEERLQRAIERASAAGDCGCSPKDACDHFEMCRACGEETVPCPDTTDQDSRHTHCYFCGEEYFINFCDRCEQRELSDVRWDDDPESYPNLCETCIENMRVAD